MRRAAGLVTLFIIALSSPAYGQARHPTPELVLKDIHGRTHRLSAYRVKVVLLNFWATWCAPCRAEMPDLIKWQREFKKRGLQIIGITYPSETLADVRKFITKIKVNYPIVLGKEETKARFDQGDVLPLTVVIDQEGAIREVIKGILFPEEFEQKVKPLLIGGKSK